MQRDREAVKREMGWGQEGLLELRPGGRGGVQREVWGVGAPPAPRKKDKEAGWRERVPPFFASLPPTVDTGTTGC